MRKCVNHVVGIICKLSVDKLKFLICNVFRTSPADYRGRFWPENGRPADYLKSGRWFDSRRRPGRGLGNPAIWKLGAGARVAVIG